VPYTKLGTRTPVVSLALARPYRIFARG
jgi:hypothetical protein